jgi:hypothetical protein
MVEYLPSMLGLNLSIGEKKSHHGSVNKVLVTVQNTWEDNLSEKGFILAHGFRGFSPSLG